MRRLLIAFTILALSLLWVAEAEAQRRDKSTVVPVTVQNRLRAEAVNYWIRLDSSNAVLSRAVVLWNTPWFCDGYGGCALVNGCIINYQPYCWAAVDGNGYYKWGEDWLRGTLVHEMGHLLGYEHGDPICTMNPDYC